jgi:hypothetical protein
MHVGRLDTFLDLQEEHDRLQQRVAELRARAPRSSAPASPTSSPASSSTSMYATTSMVPKHPISQPPQTYAPNPAEDISPSPASSGYEPGPFDYPGAATTSMNNDEDEEVKKKKVVFGFFFSFPFCFFLIYLFRNRRKRRPCQQNNMSALPAGVRTLLSGVRYVRRTESVIATHLTRALLAQKLSAMLAG